MEVIRRSEQSAIPEPPQYPLCREPIVVEASDYVSMIPYYIPAGNSFILSRVRENTNIVVVDFKMPQEMYESVSRISSFVEINGKGVIAAETSSVAGAYGLKSSEIADFYNGARKDPNYIATKGEDDLLQGLIAYGLLWMDGEEVKAQPNIAVIAMDRYCSVHSRKHIFDHEYAHALYFVDPQYAALVDNVWSSFSFSEKTFFTNALVCTGQYGNVGWLIHTETQAYFTSTPDDTLGFSALLEFAYEACQENPSDRCDELILFPDVDALLERAYFIYSVVIPSI